MGFLNVGPWELVVVLLIAVLVGGPKRTMEIARAIGRFSKQVRDLSQEFTSALQAEIDGAEGEVKESGLDLERVGREIEQAMAGQQRSDASEPERRQLETGAAHVPSDEDRLEEA